MEDPTKAAEMRTEEDSIGKMDIPSDALFGIHSVRARNNFPDITPFSIEWYKAMAMVKLACYTTVRSFRKALIEKGGDRKLPVVLPDDNVLLLLEAVAGEMILGKYFDQFIVPAVSGGAGTSINMNVNEILTNAALLKLEKSPGEYSLIDPIETANIYQSTNDVVPTALKIAIMLQLNRLEESINSLRHLTESYETQFRSKLRIAYTQMQEAVPSSFGKLFSTYNEALSRDWWRISKCFERIKVVNLGGSAVGTGMGVPRYFIMEVIPVLQQICGLPVTRSENLPDATCNLDSFVEVHAILKSHAVNLEKMVSDIRLLSSDVSGNRSLQIPAKQVGSSIMPGKVNPVIPEFVISAAHKVYSNDVLISSLSAQGCLDLNAYLPVIGHSLLESLRLLIAADETLRNNLFDDIRVTEGTEDQVMKSPSVTTALGPVIGYHNAALLATEMKKKGISVIQANEQLKLMPEDQLYQALKPENLLKTGFTLNDLLS